MKPIYEGNRLEIFHKFISYYPLKQGLKLIDSCPEVKDVLIYILLSIKTRIETKSGKEVMEKAVNLYPTIH